MRSRPYEFCLHNRGQPCPVCAQLREQDLRARRYRAAAMEWRFAEARRRIEAGEPNGLVAIQLGDAAVEAAMRQLAGYPG